jgi:hypothetical protein
MNSLIIAIIYGLSGILMKFSDDEYDENSNKIIASILAIISAVLIGYLTSNVTDAAYIFLTIIIATGLALKIDGIHHILSLIVFIIVCFLFNFFSISLFNLSLITLIMCIFSEYIDEFGNDNPKFQNNKFLKFFFDYRFTMRITVLILSLFGVYSNLTGFTIPYIHFLNLETFIFFLIFDLGYITAGKIFKKYFT